MVGWLDRNNDSIIDSTEVLLGDSATYLGQPQPKYNASMGTTVGLFHGRVTLNAEFSYQDGATQFNQGAAQALLNALISWCPPDDELVTATQARNVRALRFYQRNGFSLRETRYVYHRWLQ